jgi:hypothetical protein
MGPAIGIRTDPGYSYPPPLELVVVRHADHRITARRGSIRIMTTRVRLSGPKAAAVAGIRPATWRSYVARGAAPPPDGREEISGTPWWYAETVIAWDRDRPGVPGRPPRK